MINPATECRDHIKELITPALTSLDPAVAADKIFAVYDPDTLLKLAAKLTYPVVGVVYEGISSKGGGMKDHGLGSNLIVSLILLAGDKDREVKGQDDKAQHTEILDACRNAIKRQQSPTGHKWEFMNELPIDLKDRGMAYYQRWKTTVQLT